MKRALRIFFKMLLVLALLLMLLVASLYLPPVQRWAVDRLTAYLEKETGLEVSIGSVHLSFPLDLSLEQLHIAKPSTDAIDVERVIVDLDLTRLLMLHVGVEAVELSDGDIRMNTLVEALQINGRVGCLKVKADDIDLRKQKVSVTDAALDDCELDIQLQETPEDTTESAPLEWQIGISKVRIQNTKIKVQGSSDSEERSQDSEERFQEEEGEDVPFAFYAAIRDASLDAGDISLSQEAYRVGSLSLYADSLSIAPNLTPLGERNALALRNVELKLDNFSCNLQTSAYSAQLEKLAFSERGGFRLDKLAVNLSLDSTHLDVRGLDLQTPHSFVRGNIEARQTSADSCRREDIALQLPAPFGGDWKGAVQASLSNEDVLLLAAAYMPKELAASYPSQPLNVDLGITGTVDSLVLQTCNVVMPTVLNARVDGMLFNLMDSTMFGADLKWDIATMDLRCINRYLSLNKIHFPKMVLHADTRLRQASRLTADVLFLEGNGRAHLTGNVDLRAMAYKANARITDLQLHDFLPHDSLYLLTANAQLSGHGTDMLSPGTKLHALLNIDHLGYASWDLDSIHASTRLEKGEASFEVDSRNALIGMFGCVDATINKRKVTDAAFNMDLNHINLYALGLARKPLTASMVMHADGGSDFLQTHRLAARIEAVELVTSDSIYHPLDLTVDANLTPDLIRMKAAAGDLALSISSDQGLDSLQARYDGFMQELRRQTDSLQIQQDTLRTLLPHLSMELDCGQQNPIFNVLRHATGYTFRDLSFHLYASPQEGLKGQGHMYALNTGAILLDSILWSIRQEQSGLSFDARVANGPKNRKVVFQSQLHASLKSAGAEASLLFYDAEGKKGMDFGMAFDLLADGIRARFMPLNPIIAYRRFTLNPDNFISLTGNGHLEALVDLLTDDGTGIKLYSTPNEDARQDISLSVNHLNMGELTHVIPFMPDITGFLNGDFHYMQADSTNTVSAEMVVQKMAYNNVLLGDIGLSGVYFPEADESHYVDGIITQNEREILLFSGKYGEAKGQGIVDGQATLQGLPFAFLNAFMPDGPFSMSGYAWGDMEVNGKTDSPVLNGELRTDSLCVNADSYNINLQFPDHTITINDSRINLGGIEAYAAGKTPLVLDGIIDLSDLERVQLDLNVRANNYQLINAPKRQGALAYGKVFVNVGGRLWGTLSDLKMRGGLDVLGSTDVTCVLTDTPITVDDQLSDIVTFCDFTDTILVEQPADVVRQNIDIQMNVNIAEGAQVHCFLSNDGNDYIDLQGGGELTLTYDLQNDMQLWGRYTILKGTMRYSIMAIPLNDFYIKEGSYVEFQGNMMNPRLNISASERVRSSVTENNMPRNVAFDVGLTLSRTLDDMGLEFTLEAPEDMSVQNQLSAMTTEERGRVAVTMLVTGMYVTDDAETNGNYNYANTLNAYLQSAINKVADKAFNSIDVNFGIAEGTSDTGTKTTDYSFSFAKRFWGNRISVIVGGKVSTGRDAVNTGQTIIDNIAIEYRLDKTASRYVHLFYDRNYESLLEGQITEMGAGIVLRKKANKLSELFIFRNKEKPKAPLSERK